MTSRRRLIVGFALAAAAYLAAALATATTSSHPLRPLYEGIGPASPYRWVHPPAAFQSTNTTPFGGTETIPIGPTGTPQTTVASPDGQFVLTLPTRAIPPTVNRTGVLIDIEPLDPAKWGPLPKGFYSDGNVYHLEAQYQPGNLPIQASIQPIDLIMQTPVTSAALLYSNDGKTWTPIPDQHIPAQAAVAATFTKFGYFLAAANKPVVTGSSLSSTNLLLLVGLGLAAIAAVTASLLWRAAGRRRPPRPAGPSRG